MRTFIYKFKKLDLQTLEPYNIEMVSQKVILGIKLTKHQKLFKNNLAEIKNIYEQKLVQREHERIRAEQLERKKQEELKQKHQKLFKKNLPEIKKVYEQKFAQKEQERIRIEKIERKKQEKLQQENKILYIKSFREHNIPDILSCLELLEEDPVIAGDYYTIKKLCKDKNGNRTILKKNLHTSLHLSILNDYPDEVVYHLAKKWPELLERKSEESYTAFLNAASTARHNAAKILKEAGCNIFAGNKSNENALHLACLKNDPIMVKQLLTYGLDPNSVNVIGATPFFIAAAKGYTEIIDIFLDDNLNKNTLSIDQAKHNGITPFLAATINGHDFLLDKLKEHGADISKSNKSDENAVFLAVKFKRYNVITKLHNLGCDFYKCNKQGQSPLTLAASNQDLEMLQLFSLLEIDIYKKDRNNQDILTIAQTHKQQVFYSAIQNQLLAPNLQTNIDSPQNNTKNSNNAEKQRQQSNSTPTNELTQKQLSVTSQIHSPKPSPNNKKQLTI